MNIITRQHDTVTCTSPRPTYPARTERKRQTHQRILTTAAKLFYDHGFAAVSMDDIANAAQITKPTLYQHFSTKTELVGESLDAVEDQHFQWFVDQTDTVAQAKGTAPCLAVFDVLAKWFATPAFRGCAFINASIQLRNEVPLAQIAVFRHKHRTRQWLFDLCVRSDIPEPNCATAATQLMTTMEGAITVAAVEERETSANEARAIAELIVTQYRKKNAGA